MASNFLQQLWDGRTFEVCDRETMIRIRNRMVHDVYELISEGYNIDYESYREKTGEVTVANLRGFGLLSPPQFHYSVRGKFCLACKFGYFTVVNLTEIIRWLEFISSNYYRQLHAANMIKPLSPSQFLYSDRGNFHFAEKFGYSKPLYPGSKSNPGKFHFADGSGYRSLLFDPNYNGAADRFRTDSAYKAKILNTGMSSGGCSKGNGGEPTKGLWKLGLSVEAVTPNFIASANISLEMKNGSGSGSGSGSNSKPPALPTMPKPLVFKVYECFLGVKKKFID